MFDSSLAEWAVFVGALAAAIVVVIKALKVEKTVNDTHTLVNSQRGELLKQAVIAADLLVIAKDTPENQERSKSAREALSSHETQQAIVNGTSNKPTLNKSQ